MARVKSALLALLLIGAVGGLVVWAYRPSPIGVEVGEVRTGTFVAVVEEDGRTRVRDRYVVSSPLAGRLRRPAVRAGDTVSAGTSLATLLPSLPPLLEARTRQELGERVGAAEAGLQEATVRLERAQAQEKQARNDVERIRSLYQKGVASIQQLEREDLALQLAERDRRAAELRRHASEHDVEQARALLRRYEEPDAVETWEIRSPVDGRVLRVHQESEAPVAAGTSLFEVGDPGDLEIIVDLLTADAVSLRPGAPVVIRGWGGPVSLAGRVRLVEPSAFTKVSALGVEEQRVWVIIDISSPRTQWETLGDAFRVEVWITTEELSDVLVAPASALFRRGDAWAAFVVKDGVARETAVDIKRRSGRSAAVSSGLSTGDTVVLFPPGKLTDGARVKIRETR